MTCAKALTGWLLLVLTACGGGADAARAASIPTSEVQVTEAPARSSDVTVAKVDLRTPPSLAPSAPDDEGVGNQTQAANDLMKLPPMSDQSTAAFLERCRVSERAVRYDVVKTSGPLAASDFDFALQLLRIDLAECVSKKSSVLKGEVVIELVYDAVGSPQSATVSRSSLAAATPPCLKNLLAKVDPMSHTETTSEKQANERATIKLTFDVPAGF